MPSTTVSKIPLPTPEELQRVEAVLGFVFNEIEGLQTALNHAETSADDAFKRALADGATPEAASEAAGEAEDAARLPALDDEMTGRLLMFLSDVTDELGYIGDMVRACVQKVRQTRHDNTAGYDGAARIRIQEAIGMMSAASDDA